ncbi:uncharacterized mitochondrial protein AtMg00810-like [Schistocerca piceifrons]|uniref:uncharacterized mitochondrial protein AtMg00810-like n=1 Tax=Schistocerca piceifrons TaxID=274613 RepID=UPI001F5F8D0C|nr:uncharacterized mitochondrial protein AtMg00810-like [Schistocerca piceifrons]
MKKAGFSNSDADPCLFYRRQNGNSLYVVIYVDDGLIVGSNKKEIAVFMDVLQHEFEITTGSLDNFLGIKIKQYEDGAIMISQGKYTEEILQRFRMAECNTISTPIGREDNNQNEEVSSFVPYREAIGCLMYLSTVNKAARAMEKPTTEDWSRVKRIFRYLKGTLNFGIVYNKKEELKIYADADFAGDNRTRRSTTGILAKYSGGAVSWTSQWPHPQPRQLVKEQKS